ncbi:hypothetical protein PHMEG_00041256 [Phytophthora megakarya]|uniref:Uncharacterized protein n=1 Tax=Phytophthora megakarya TaxID=4795 RepID=A0A225UBZ1_9STRA|nr:hypothetical protein PHMEG_00041256 [Phytophthora megakarya]
MVDTSFGCSAGVEAYNPAEAPSFHWGVGFDDSYYNTPNRQRLSKGTKLRLKLCGLEVTPQSYPAVDLSSVDARASSFDSGFDFICASPVSCPLPPGLESTRTLPTTLQLRSRDGIGSGKLTFNSGNSFSSTGIKRKAPSDSSGYPSYSPTTPPSPFLNDFAGAGTFNNTRVRSRVSVGCNGWYLNDDDAVNKGWYRRGSSGEVKLMNLPQLSQLPENPALTEIHQNDKR